MTSTAVQRSSRETFRTRDYGYANARVRGMRARLFSREQLERLLEIEDIKLLVQELMNSEYAVDLEEALIRGRGAAEVDEALRANLVRTYAKVLHFLNDEAFTICSALLGRWDVFNLKTILRGKHLGLSVNEIQQGLMPVGVLSQSDLDGLLSAPDVRGVVELAVTWGIAQANALRSGMHEYTESGAISELELPIDRYYAEWAAMRLARQGSNYAIGRWMLAAQVDSVNLILVFRAARENLPADQASRYFVSGGSDIGLDRYLRLAAMSDVDEILDDLRGTRYGQVLDEAAVRYLETTSLAVFERALEDQLTRRILALNGRDPLGVGVPIAYLWAKANEVTNLRVIVKCRAIGLAMDRARRELILV